MSDAIILLMGERNVYVVLSQVLLMAQEETGDLLSMDQLIFMLEIIKLLYLA